MSQISSTFTHFGIVGTAELATSAATDLEEEQVSPPKLLRPLTSLKWPYVPEQSAYPDPLDRDDPKALQLHQYEAIGTSSVQTVCG
jgi:hypothetical protein